MKFGIFVFWVGSFLLAGRDQPSVGLRGVFNTMALGFSVAFRGHGGGGNGGEDPNKKPLKPTDTRKRARQTEEERAAELLNAARDALAQLRRVHAGEVAAARANSESASSGRRSGTVHAHGQTVEGAFAVLQQAHDAYIDFVHTLYVSDEQPGPAQARGLLEEGRGLVQPPEATDAPAVVQTPVRSVSDMTEGSPTLARLSGQLNQVSLPRRTPRDIRQNLATIVERLAVSNEQTAQRVEGSIADLGERLRAFEVQAEEVMTIRGMIQRILAVFDAGSRPLQEQAPVAVFVDSSVDPFASVPPAIVDDENDPFA